MEEGNCASSGLVDVFVSGDGGAWSCGPSTLFQIPTDLFDKAMMVYALNSPQDLHDLEQQARREIDEGRRRKQSDSSAGEWTTVYASHDGSWAGLPPVHFLIPADVFAYLSADEKRSKAIGWLDSDASLQSLVASTRQEMADEDEEEEEAKQQESSGSGSARRGACSLCSRQRFLATLEAEGPRSDGRAGEGPAEDVCRRCIALLRGARGSALRRTETKLCGHVCTISSLKDGCCGCADLRPVLEDGQGYPLYVDGEGWRDTASRGAGYCPVCRY